MQILKYTGILILCLSLSSVGFYAVFFHTRRLRLLKILSEFFSEFSSLQAVYSGEAVLSLRRLSESERFRELSFLRQTGEVYKQGDDLKEVWCEAVKAWNEGFYLGRQYRQQLLLFSELFGRRGAEEFNGRCKEYALMFLQSAQKEELSKNKNTSLYAGCGLFAAAAVFIILI